MNTSQNITEKYEEIEGLGKDEDASWGDYPIDTMLIRNETRTVHDVLRRIEKNTFIMDPDFQRDFIWPVEKQSKLIESVLLRIPLPVFYLAEDSRGRMIVVDGLQRLSTFRSFVNNEFRLILSEQKELNGKRFQDLSAKMQNRIEDCSLILYVIDSKVPERAMLDIFERVNGGVPLTRQQMRNCLFMGPATRFLKEEASSELFKKATGGSLRSTTMRDREFVNRFCAFQLLSFQEYKGDMDVFLAQALTKMNRCDEGSLRNLSAQFRLGLANNYAVFGQQSFRKYQIGQNYRSVLNASLWDVLSTGLSRYPESRVEARAQSIESAILSLLRDDDFERAISYGTNDLRAVRTRFHMANICLQEVLDDNAS